MHIKFFYLLYLLGIISIQTILPEIFNSFPVIGATVCIDFCIILDKDMILFDVYKPSGVNVTVFQQVLTNVTQNMIFKMQ
jgi:hypothetical protein